MDVTIAPLFESPNGVNPKGIVIVEVIEGFGLPGIDVREALARTPIQGPPENLQESSLVHTNHA